MLIKLVPWKNSKGMVYDSRESARALVKQKRRSKRRFLMGSAASTALNRRPYAMADHQARARLSLLFPGSRGRLRPRSGIYIASSGRLSRPKSFQSGELRIYLYNNFTKPISAKPYVDGTYAEVVGLNPQKEAMGDPVRLTFGLAPDGSYLTTSIPKEVKFPLSVTAWVKFDRTRADLFNFTFERVSDFK